MLEIDIPGFGRVLAEHLVTDFTGTLALDGKLLAGTEERLQALSEILELHVVTSDTFGLAQSSLKDVRCTLRILDGVDHDLQKEEYVKKLGPENVIAVGNGRNDSHMLRTARIGIAVSTGEGCAVHALKHADIHVRSIEEALDLLLYPDRLKATLRY